NGANIEPQEKQTVKYYDRLAAVLTPFSKYFNAEMCNRTAYDGIQVMGGSGYMKDYPMERYYRDARITNIYEGTSQLQVVAAIGGILTGVLDKEFDKFKELNFNDDLASLANVVKTMISSFNAAVLSVKDKKDHEYTDFVAERIVKMGLDIFISTLFLDAAKTDERKAKLAEIWICKTKLSVNNNSTFIINGERNIIDNHLEIIN
ncbi:MAG: acyl-CoA dehydrogenase, partial [Planctomycetia bacterium]|nr:acyl-CoA dehydrogenase [Planctomycetia bacterium]